jgi:micrococcal nuclease
MKFLNSIMSKFLKFVPLIAIIFLGLQIKAQEKSLPKTSDLKQYEAQVFDEYEVVANSVHDGDTLRVRSPKLGTVLKIRLACIDAPELKQPMGEESRNYLRSIVNRGGNKVKLQPITVDRYGRTVAQLWNDSGLIQSQMASAGMAYGYEQYKKDCPNWEAVRSTQDQAQQARSGIWALPNGGERPWDYRKSKK